MTDIKVRAQADAQVVGTTHFTAMSGVIVAVRMYETHRHRGTQLTTAQAGACSVGARSGRRGARAYRPARCGSGCSPVEDPWAVT